MNAKTKEKHTIFLIPHTHYDAIWVFTKEDYFYINISFILEKVVDLIEKTNYKFLIEQTFLLEEIEKKYPKLFLKIANYIKQGKIEIADGEYLMADTMMPNGETLIREIYFGKKYAKEKFGIDVPVMWQADSFGLNSQLPQIYKKSGYKYVAFRRGAEYKKPSEFLWQGLDNTNILAHWMPLGYRAGFDLSELNKNYKKLKKLSATKCVLMPSGSGVTMPQPETIDFVKKWNKNHRNEEMKIATPIEFFKNLEKKIKQENIDLKIRKGEMYCGKYSEVFPDCCSSRMWIKQGLFKYENSMLGLEKFAAISYLLGNVYPYDELTNCWKKILFIAFHDVIPGTGIDECYLEVKQYFEYLFATSRHFGNNIFHSIINKELMNNKYENDEKDIIVFNPLSWNVKNWTEIELNFDKGKIKEIIALESKEQEIDIELIKLIRFEDNSIKYAKIGFIADVPAIGYRTYKILQKKSKKKFLEKSLNDENFIKIKANTIKNKFFTINVNHSSGLIDIINCKNKIKANQIVIEEENGDLYYHKQSFDKAIKTEDGEGIKYGAFRVESFQINESKIRAVIDIKVNYFSLRWPYRLVNKRNPLLWRQKSLICKKKIIIYKDIPRIDFITNIENKHPKARIRLKFSTNTNSKKYFCGTQFGVIERKTNQADYKEKEKWKEKPNGEFPALGWLDYPLEKNGLTIINKGIPQAQVQNGNINLTLLRSVSMVSSDGKTGPAIPTPDAEELKKYTFKYSLYPHKENWKNALSYRHALEFNTDLIGFQLKENTNLPYKKSFLKIEPQNIILSAMKKSDDGNGVILRFYETQGEKTKATITLYKKPKSVKYVNILEQEDKNIKNALNIKDNKIILDVNAFEIICLEIS